MAEKKNVSASLTPELAQALEGAVESDPEVNQSQLIREGLRMRLQLDQ